MKKTIITVVGKDRVGIIAKVCVYLAENNINILDIAQTIVDGYFNMMMVVNAEAASKDHDQIGGSCRYRRGTWCADQGTAGRNL